MHRRWLRSSALGSLRARTDGSGTVVSTDIWDVWGNPRSTPSAGLYGWTGEPRDPTTNLVYLRARDYSAGTGRFETRDTVSPNGPGTQGYNPYAYVSGNPTTFTDPTGHSAFEGSAMFSIGASTTLGFSLIFGAVLVAAGVGLFSVGAFTAFNFFVVAVIFFVLLLHASQVMNCSSHGVSYGECFGGSAEGSGTLNIDPGIARFSISGAASAVASCAAKFGLFLYNASLYFKACPGSPNEPDDDCDLIEDVVDTADTVLDVVDSLDGDSNSPGGGGGSPTIPDDGGPAVPPNNPMPPIGDQPPPGNGWEWRGAPGALPGSDKGNWVNVQTGEEWHPHNEWSKHGPHSDYTDPDGNTWRRYSDGRWEPKKPHQGSKGSAGC